jgi:diacylglycerol kinase (ATP)
MSPFPIMKNQPFRVRVGFALNGIAHTFRVEPGFKFHTLAAAGVLAALCITRAPAHWWAIAAITVSAVMAAELLNTAIEHLADHLHPQRHPIVGIVKDCAAGAVLVVSIAALGVAVAFVVDVVL